MPAEALLQPAAPALDLQEGISDPSPVGGCARWPENLRLRSTLGALVPGRCKATNLCDRCATLAAVENSELLALDALYGPAPTVWCVLTTRSTSIVPADFWRAREQLMRALKRRWPLLEVAWLVEYTTGYGTRSGGARRPHWNGLLKGVNADDLAALHEVLAKVWCPRVDALPDAQHVGTIGEAGGLMRYLALHFQKESQRPPAGWRGHRFLKTAGYLWTDTAAAREEARSALALKRALWRAHRDGLVGEDAELAAQRDVYEASELAWELVRLQPIPTDFDADGMPCSWVTEVEAVR